MMYIILEKIFLYVKTILILDKKNLICKFDEKRYNSNSKKIEKYNYKSKNLKL